MAGVGLARWRSLKVFAMISGGVGESSGGSHQHIRDWNPNRRAQRRRTRTMAVAIVGLAQEQAEPLQAASEQSREQRRKRILVKTGEVGAVGGWLEADPEEEAMGGADVDGDDEDEHRDGDGGKTDDARGTWRGEEMTKEGRAV